LYVRCLGEGRRQTLDVGALPTDDGLHEVSDVAVLTCGHDGQAEQIGFVLDRRGQQPNVRIVVRRTRTRSTPRRPSRPTPLVRPGRALPAAAPSHQRDTTERYAAQTSTQHRAPRRSSNREGAGHAADRT
jgi:hypothetical protein